MIPGNGLLDPDTIKVMDEAFDLAWRSLRSDPVLGEIDRTILRDSLARELLFSVHIGERCARRLADGAIEILRRTARASAHAHLNVSVNRPSQKFLGLVNARTVTCSARSLKSHSISSSMVLSSSQTMNNRGLTFRRRDGSDVVQFEFLLHLVMSAGRH
jgi:hypothetical protein